MMDYHPLFKVGDMPYTAPVGSFSIGSTGGGYGDYRLVDMAGNAREWCWDRFSKDYYGSQEEWRDPRGPMKGGNRVLRGGGWGDSATDLRNASRLQQHPTSMGPRNGFRLVFSLAP